MKKICVTIIFCWLLLPLSIFAQSQTNPYALSSDSAKQIYIQQQANQLKQIELERQADSLKKINLFLELQNFSATKLQQRQDLQQQLDLLRQKDSLRVAEQKQKIDSLKKIMHGYAVAPFNDTLFTVYTSLGSFSAADRAHAINHRIQELANNYNFSVDSLSVIDNINTVDIVFHDLVVMSISENDALWENTTQQQLAKTYQLKIKSAIQNYRQETSWQNITKQIILALFVIIVLIFIIRYVIKFSAKIESNIAITHYTWIQGVKIKNYELLSVEQEIHLMKAVLRILKWIFIFIAIYLAFPLVFGIFPWTKKIATTLLTYFVDPLKQIFLGIWHYLPNLITILVILFVFRLVLKGILYLKKEIEKGSLSIPGFYADWANPSFQIVRILLFAFLLIVIFPYLPGSNSPVFRGVSVFLGVLFTFGSSGSLSNIIAGLVLTYMRSFKLGDRIQIADVTGDVIEKNLLVTRIRTIKNEIISIPNATILNSHTINYSSDATERGLIVHTTITIGYDAPWRQVHALLIKAALATTYVEKDPEPFVLQTSLNDFYVSYQINAYTKYPNKQAELYSLLHANIQDTFNEAGVEIMSAHYTNLRDGNQTTIPSDYLPKNYTAPNFNIRTENSKVNGNKNQ
ncbi:MAG: mechanosensitive ion channel [Bacteroidota bacterium]|jgi:small-conductance mechanosensitive channel|nr:mechanosensitive ion channel [Bacteroidota bacterium]